MNLSARLMQAAAPGQILVSQAVQHASGDTFVWQDLLAIRVKGKTEPVIVSSPVRARRRRTISLSEREYALPMVGREAELALIKEKLALVLEGRGQIVGITGEAGVGKSRLVAELIRAASDRQLTGYASECESYGTNTSYAMPDEIELGGVTARFVALKINSNHGASYKHGLSEIKIFEEE